MNFIQTERETAKSRAIEWARQGLVACPRCHGTGVYYWGTVVNGVPSYRGVCFKCNGAKTVSNKAGSKRILKAREAESEMALAS